MTNWNSVLILSRKFFFTQGNKATRNATTTKEKPSDESMDQDMEDANENKLVQVMYKFIHSINWRQD